MNEKSPFRQHSAYRNLYASCNVTQATEQRFEDTFTWCFRLQERMKSKGQLYPTASIEHAVEEMMNADQCHASQCDAMENGFFRFHSKKIEPNPAEMRKLNFTEKEISQCMARWDRLKQSGDSIKKSRAAA